MVERSELLSTLFDEKTVKVLKRLLLKKDIFYLRDISREAGVSLATTFRIVQKLKDLGLVERQKRDKFTFYSLIKETPVYNDVYALVLGSELDPVDLLKKGLQEQYGPGTFEMFMIKGKGKKLFIVSQRADNAIVKKVADQIKEKTGIKLDFLVTNKVQFEQMQQMGLISKEKTKLI